MHISVGVHIRHTFVASFYNGPVKKSMYAACYEEENAYLKDLKIICQFLFSSVG